VTVKKFARLALGFSLAAIFVWLIFRHISLDDIRTAFRQASPTLVLAAVAAFFVGYSCRIERWRLMLKKDNPTLQWKHCAGPLMASVAANNVLPFRAGDILRAFGFNRRLGISAATSVTSLFVERLLDLLMVVAFLGVALACFGMESSRFIGVGGTFLIGGAAAIVFILLFPGAFKPLAFWLGRLPLKLSPVLGERILGQIHKVFEALEHMASGHTMVKLILWSTLAWISEGLVFWFTALALPSILHPLAAWIALPIGTLATVIPSTPGYVGTFDFITAQAMTVLGDSTTATTAYALLVHVLLWLPPTIVGGLYLLINPIRQKKDGLKAVSP
jgi:glycosyltransferase 2 family protein